MLVSEETRWCAVEGLGVGTWTSTERAGKSGSGATTLLISLLWIQAKQLAGIPGARHIVATLEGCSQPSSILLQPWAALPPAAPLLFLIHT